MITAFPAFTPHGDDADDVTFVIDDLVEHAKIPAKMSRNVYAPVPRCVVISGAGSRTAPNPPREDTDAMPSRVTHAPVAGADKLFTPDFSDYLVALHDALDGRARQLRDARAALDARHERPGDERALQ